MTEYGGISVRTLEFIIAVYFAAVGILFLADVTSFDAPIYAQWATMGTVFWGIVMLMVSMVHVFALWLNGRAPQTSKPLRILACVLHLGIALQFARMFIDAGAVWGAITYLGLVAPIAVLICIPQARRWTSDGKF